MDMAQEGAMYIPLDLVVPVLAVALGALTLVRPKLAPHILGIFLIAYGVVELLPHIR